MNLSRTALFKQSFAIIKQKKSLLLLPLISGVCILILFALLIMMLPVGHILAEINAPQAHQLPTSQTTALIIAGIVFFFALTFITIFCNAALTICTLDFIKTNDCQISTGIKAAAKRLHVIFLWSLTATTIGVIMQLIETGAKRFPILESFISTAFGIAWSVATFFVVPILVAENMSPLKAIKRSGQLIRQTWGTSLRFWFSISILLVLMLFISALPTALGFYLGGHLNITIGLAVSAILLVGTILLYSTARSVLVTGLYLYATGETHINGFDKAALQTALKPKRKKANLL